MKISDTWYEYGVANVPPAEEIYGAQSKGFVKEEFENHLYCLKKDPYE